MDKPRPVGPELSNPGSPETILARLCDVPPMDTTLYVPVIRSADSIGASINEPPQLGAQKSRTHGTRYALVGATTVGVLASPSLVQTAHAAGPADTYGIHQTAEAPTWNTDLTAFDDTTGLLRHPQSSPTHTVIYGSPAGATAPDYIDSPLTTPVEGSSIDAISFDAALSDFGQVSPSDTASVITSRVAGPVTSPAKVFTRGASSATTVIEHDASVAPSVDIQPGVIRATTKPTVLTSSASTSEQTKPQTLTEQRIEQPDITLASTIIDAPSLASPSSTPFDFAVNLADYGVRQNLPTVAGGSTANMIVSRPAAQDQVVAPALPAFVSDIPVVGGLFYQQPAEGDKILSDISGTPVIIQSKPPAAQSTKPESKQPSTATAEIPGRQPGLTEEMFRTNIGKNMDASLALHPTLKNGLVDKLYINKVANIAQIRRFWCNAWTSTIENESGITYVPGSPGVIKDGIIVGVRFNQANMSANPNDQVVPKSMVLNHTFKPKKGDLLFHGSSHINMYYADGPTADTFWAQGGNEHGTVQRSLYHWSTVDITAIGTHFPQNKPSASTATISAAPKPAAPQAQKPADNGGLIVNNAGLDFGGSALGSFGQPSTITAGTSTVAESPTLSTQNGDGTLSASGSPTANGSSAVSGIIESSPIVVSSNPDESIISALPIINAPTPPPVAAPTAPAPTTTAPGPSTDGQTIGLPNNGVKHLTRDDVSRMIPNATPQALDNVPLIINALDEFHIDTPRMEAYAFGTIEAETDTTVNGQKVALQPISELGQVKGEVISGGFERYKGRGFIQLTHDYNYRDFGNKIGVDLLHNPERANEPAVAARVLAAFLSSRATRIENDLKAGDLPNSRRAVNGGTNGLDKFSTSYRIGAAALGI